ncbi:MAG: redoxin domain-containing protein [Lewinella sp.]|nr:redoxin domain-containing protein [Lewinella sp.]
MRYLATAMIIFLTVISLPARPLTVGEQMPELEFIPVGTTEKVSLSAFREKAVVLEFWATWCSPCIRSMQHLKELEQTFGGDLVIIAISDETTARINTFQANTDFPFIYVQESEALREYFPHRVIPHTIVLSPQLKISAITRPEALTESGISVLLAGKAVDLPLKEDRPWDMTLDIFGLDTTARQSFQIQPHRSDAPTHSRSYNKGPFRERRRSFVNFQVPMLYREALNTSVYRMEIPEAPEQETFCVDILVAPEQQAQLEQMLLDSLTAYFGWMASRQPQEREVWVLYAKSTGITLPTAGDVGERRAGGDHFISPDATPAAFAEYLESYGIAGMPVVDDTQIDQRFRFDFSFEPENPDSFFKALDGMGLAVKKEKRVIDVFRLVSLN